ncbi:PLP-dependent transferase [Poronia punctata]|nr:PLP-dependent transferase [Poronia punctata]
MSQKKKKSINLLRGWPATSLLPAEALGAASQTALTDQSIWAPGLEYGPDPGYQPLREELARWLGAFYDEEKEEEEGAMSQPQSDRITITGGASQSLACILQSFTDPGQTLAVWVVAPCYFLACPIFDDAGFAGRLRAVPEDEEGVDIDVLEREMRAVEIREEEEEKEKEKEKENERVLLLLYKDPGPHRKIYRHVVYCVPAFSNPSGRTMTRARREGLVGLARKYDALVICDDVYDMLQWRQQHTSSSSSSPSTRGKEKEKEKQKEKEADGLNKALLPRLADIDIRQGPSPFDPPGKHFGHVVSNGSFSKLVAPGVRTGWTYSTGDLAVGMAMTGSTRSGGAPSQFTATVICQLLRGGEVTGHIDRVLRPAYSRRHGVLVRAINSELVPLGVEMRGGSLRGREDVYGGYFVWIHLPRSKTGWPAAREIADRCRVDEDLLIGNGELFAVHGDEEAARFEDGVRLCFSWEDEEDLEEGVRRLARVIKTMLNEGPDKWRREKKGPGEVDDGK